MMAAAREASRLRLLDEALEVRWPDGSESRLPYLWLRDNCSCDQCRVPQTSEKRFILAEVPVDLRPASAAADGDELWLRWPDGHETRYPGATIRALESPDETGCTLWDSEFVPPRCDYRRFQQDDATAAAALDAFLAHGALILSHAPRAPGTMEALAPRLGPLRELLFARIHDVEVDPRGYNVAHTSLALPPHNDFASYSWPPSVQALHMLENDVPGGDTIIVDGWRIVKELRADRPEDFEALCRTPVPFRMFDDDNETCAAAPVIRLDTAGNVAGFRFSNQLMQAVPPNQGGLDAFYRAYHELCRRVTDPSAQASFRLEAGQILIVASHRVLHARKAFAATGRRHLQDAYFEHDNIRNRLVVLKRRLAEQGGDLR